MVVGAPNETIMLMKPIVKQNVVSLVQENIDLLDWETENVSLLLKKIGNGTSFEYVF